MCQNIKNMPSCQKDVKLSKRCQMSKNETPRLWRRFTKIALCGLRWFKLNVSKYQKDVKLSKRCQVVKKMSSCQKDVKCQKMKHLDYGGGSQKN